MAFSTQNRTFDETNSHQETAYSEGNNCNASVVGNSPTNEALIGAICPNCGARLEGRKCKLFCPTVGCGYMVTCSEW